MRQIPLAISPRPEPSFSSFLLPDPSVESARLSSGDNRLAHRELQALSHKLADSLQTGEPVARPDAVWFMWGPQGSGKSHLLASLAASVPASLSVTFLRPGQVPALQTESPPQLLLVDGVDRFDEQELALAFAHWVDVSARQGVVVATAQVPPVDMELREDLRTRLGSGPVLHLEPLSEQGVRLALKQEAARRGLQLPEEVLDYILVRMARDLRHLMGLLDQLDHYALTYRRPVTMPLLRQMLSELSP